MGELLKDVMNEQAQAAGGPRLDVDAIIAAGDKRIRRNRIVATVGVAAAMVIAAVAVPAVIDRDTLGDKGVQPASPTGAFVERHPTYAAGTTVYYGDDAIDVAPHEVSSLVQTDFGFVFTAPKGDHQDVYFTDATTTTKIGETAQEAGTMLAADDSGPYVEWVDTNAQPLPEFVVYDTSAKKEVARTSEGNVTTSAIKDEFDQPVVHAIDGETAYWHSSAGTVAYDLTDGSQDVLRPHSGPSYLFDVSNGVFAYSARDLSTAVNHTLGPDRPFVPGIGEPMLSPFGDYVMTMPGRNSEVYETATQRRVTPTSPGFGVLLMTQWIDDQTYAAVGAYGDSLYTNPLNLAECSLTTGVCEPAGQSIGRLDQVVFPVGGSLTDR